jgi:hypothetical protein
MFLMERREIAEYKVESYYGGFDLGAQAIAAEYGENTDWHNRGILKTTSSRRSL